MSVDVRCNDLYDVQIRFRSRIMETAYLLADGNSETVDGGLRGAIDWEEPRGKEAETRAHDHEVRLSAG